jgi:hypothetical protein
MIDITKASAKQSTGVHGVLSPWKVMLGDQLLYTLAKETTVEDTFSIRDDIEKLIKKAYEAGLIHANNVNTINLKHVVTTNEAKVTILIQENERLAVALEQHIISEEN